MTTPSTTGRLRLWAIVADGLVRGFAVLCPSHEAQKELLLVDRIEDKWQIPLFGLDLVRVTRRDWIAAIAEDEKNGRTVCTLCIGAQRRPPKFIDARPFGVAELRREGSRPASCGI